MQPIDFERIRMGELDSAVKFEHLRFEQLKQKVCGKARFSADWQKTCENCGGNESCKMWNLLKLYLTGEKVDPEEKEEVVKKINDIQAKRKAGSMKIFATGENKRAYRLTDDPERCEKIKEYAMKVKAREVGIAEAAEACGYKHPSAFRDAVRKLKITNSLSGEPIKNLTDEDFRAYMKRMDAGENSHKVAQEAGYANYNAFAKAAKRRGVFEKRVNQGRVTFQRKETAIKLSEAKRLVDEGMKLNDALRKVGYINPYNVKSEILARHGLYRPNNVSERSEKEETT